MFNVTGSQQLNIAGLIAKFGKMALSCTGCGTGTCDNINNSVDAPAITASVSNAGIGVEAALGYLV